MFWTTNKASLHVLDSHSANSTAYELKFDGCFNVSTTMMTLLVNAPPPHFIFQIYHHNIFQIGCWLHLFVFNCLNKTDIICREHKDKGSILYIPCIP